MDLDPPTSLTSAASPTILVREEDIPTSSQAEQPGVPAGQAPTPRPASSAPNQSPVPGPALANQRPSSTQPWPATALTSAPDASAIPGPPTAAAISGVYRPLNFNEVLPYLLKVTIKFHEQPDVYNQFLDIMKDLEDDTTDTPGIIERVSTLFNGHPSLIQGFNTFLPQGYRIECSEGEDSTNTITVTTPTGIHTKTAEIIQHTTRSFVATPIQTPGVAQPNSYFPPGPPGAPPPTSSPDPHGPSPGAGAPLAPFNDPVPPPAGTPMGHSHGLPPQQLPHSVSPRPIHSPDPTTSGVATVLGGQQHSNSPPVVAGPLVATPPSQPQVIAQDSKRPVEFNNAIIYVNKIKNRFASDPDTYKQFLEILQTYQKEQRPLQSVYRQIAVLFDGSTDLLDEFKQFLPDTAATALDSDAMNHTNDIGSAITQISAIPIKISGHFCDLFEGMHMTAGRVALKRPRIGATGYDDVIVRRFEREAATWRNLRHPHILEFLGTFKRDGHIYFVSPFIKNGTLVEYIADYPNVNRIQLICQTADAVQYLHKERIVHGDLKANNILIHDNGYSLLCDFGLTKTSDSRTSTAMIGAGTLRWQSPELWDNAPKTFESDVYAFSMTIVEVLTGKAPFAHYPNDGAVMRAVLLRDERPSTIPNESSNGISYQAIWEVAAACWPREPADRLSMSEAHERIRADPSLIENPTL